MKKLFTIILLLSSISAFAQTSVINITSSVQYYGGISSDIVVAVQEVYESPGQDQPNKGALQIAVKYWKNKSEFQGDSTPVQVFLKSRYDYSLTSDQMKAGGSTPSENLNLILLELQTAGYTCSIITL